MRYGWEDKNTFNAYEETETPFVWLCGTGCRVPAGSGLTPIHAQATNQPPAQPKAKNADPKPAPAKKLTGSDLYQINCNRCHPERYATECDSGAVDDDHDPHAGARQHSRSAGEGHFEISAGRCRQLTSKNYHDHENTFYSVLGAVDGGMRVRVWPLFLSRLRRLSAMRISML